MKLLSCILVSLAAGATASPAPWRRSLATTLSRDITVTEEEVKKFDFYAQYAAASYCNSEADANTTITCSNDACPDVTSAGAKVLASFSGIITDIKGFVATDDTNGLIVVSFRGSSSIRNWITDLTFFKIPCDLVDGCELHAGFKVAWDEVQNAVVDNVRAARETYPSYKTIITGHSLGGAVATIAAAYTRDALGADDIDLYTYGSPRTGNKAFAAGVTEQAGLEYRITHTDDPVPRLPPIFIGYSHVSPEYWFYTGGSDTDDYGPEDAKVCEGYINVSCNGGTDGFDTDAHLHYFEKIDGCTTSGGLQFRKRDAVARNAVRSVAVTPDMATSEPENLTDAELEAKLNDFVRQDIEYVKANA